MHRACIQKNQNHQELEQIKHLEPAHRHPYNWNYLLIIKSHN